MEIIVVLSAFLKYNKNNHVTVCVKKLHDFEIKFLKHIFCEHVLRMYKKGDDIRLDKKQPLHHIVTETLIKQIKDGTYKEGNKIPSENELAKKLEISRQTVRHAINTLEQKGYVYRIQGSGTFVGHKFKKSETKTIGVIITYLNDYIFPSIIQGIDSVLSAKGYTMNLGITHNKIEKEYQALQRMLLNGVDGIIIEGTKSALPNLNTALFQQLKKEGIPYIFINGNYDNTGNGYVLLDDVKASQTVCEELIMNGHTDIGGIFKSDDIQGQKRYQGFINKMKQHQLSISDESIIWYTTEDLDYLFCGKLDSVVLERLENVTGIVCYNDEIAAALIKLFKRNSVDYQNKYSIISFDNSTIASSSVYDLTSYEYPCALMGETAAEAILKIVSGEEQKVIKKLNGFLKKRHSVKKLY
jgi:GntR family transcriptional regulator of arabinose operon